MAAGLMRTRQKAFHRPGARLHKDRIYRELRQDILALALKPGQLVVERDIARQFGVSKTPVRDALAVLQQDGLIEALPRRGYLVTSITVADVYEMFEVRAVLEGAAAELAATRMTAEDLARLESVTNPLGALVRRAGGRLDRRAMQRLLDYNRHFHLAIARGARNARLLRLIERVLDDGMRLIAIGYVANEHEEIVAALRAGDPTRARAAMVNHVLMTQERVLKGEGPRR
jgi:DNA-binding GntR family transcriptional regulator